MTHRARGWRALRRGATLLLIADEIAHEADVLGLVEPWRLTRPRPPGPGTGRGPVGIVRPEQGPALFVKRALRGGLLARVNRARYFGTARFRRELEVSGRAREADLPVADTLSVTLVPARPGWHAWTAARLVEESHDLARALARPGDDAARRGILRAAARAVIATHDAGLVHRDLNLGNVVVRPCKPDAYEAFVVDLDRARWLGRPLPRATRVAASGRLARSWSRIFGDDGPVQAADLDALLLDPVALGHFHDSVSERD